MRFISGSHVSVGWSKLCQATSPEGERSTRFPESKSRSSDAGEELSDSQILEFVESETAIRPPERRRVAEERLLRGVLRLATQT